MAAAFVTGRGVTIQIGRELGKGGEGSVHEVLTNPDQVAKLYHADKMPDDPKQAKLSFMAAAADNDLLSYTAWPQDTLHKNHKAPVVGFLMPKVTGHAPIHMLYSPAHRRQDYPAAAWNFLLFSARNTAAAFTALHSHGHVLGDVNQGNVLVGGDSKVVLIDCDSFQINANGKIHHCAVGVSHFTPPELQGVSTFDGIRRTVNHDNFGLALLIFHILFGGRHPYSGIPLRQDVGEALETDIKMFRFAYARDAQRRGIRPPPHSIPLSLVPDAMEAMFEIAFTERGASGGRPSAQQWLSALDGLRGHLQKCGANAMHVYPDHLGSCPWCVLDGKGVIYFIDLGLGFTSTTNGFELAKVWAIIEAVAAPPPVVIPNIASLSVTPTPLPLGNGCMGPVVLVRLIIIGSAIGLFTVVPGAWFLIAIGVWAAWNLAGTNTDSEPDTELAKRRLALDEARMEYAALENRVRKEGGPEDFIAKKQELERLKDEHQKLPNTEQRELEKLRATAERRQKQRFLERCFIDSANILGLGSTKKAALRSFGIETAADVEWNKVLSVRGFGETLTRAVVDWKKSCERRFVFDPRNALSEADKNSVRAKVAGRRRSIEAALASGASDLQRFRQEAASKATALYPELNAAAQRLAQALADLKPTLKSAPTPPAPPSGTVTVGSSATAEPALGPLMFVIAVILCLFWLVSHFGGPNNNTQSRHDQNTPLPVGVSPQRTTPEPRRSINVPPKADKNNTSSQGNLTTKAIQRQLKRLGYDIGQIDGRVGKKTQAAIIAFQEREHIAIDGLPSAELLSYLLEKYNAGHEE